MGDDRLTMYADYVCPFCYLGRVSMMRYRDQHDAALPVEWHPFDLRANRRDESGELVRESQKDDAYYEQAWRNVDRLADEYGVEMPEGPILHVDSLSAQQLSSYVQEHHPDDWLTLDRALYEAVWQEDRDIGDRSVLAELAEVVGLEDDVVEAALGDPERRSDLADAFAAARRRGITGVPTFVYRDRAARGAVPPDRLRRLVEPSEP